ncbi:hypothetical protein [Cryobacterium sp. Y11]|uniref:hypothetical protein n=1 Tax=Cryobacterium sp. Y11 TaxID=2045016 RepID=UPI0011B04AEE|nr:hypothetical protein [Cryobacterium sp. Y11]
MPASKKYPPELKERAVRLLLAAREDAARLLELERENRELRRSNAILRSAAAFFAAELDRPSSR